MRRYTKTYAMAAAAGLAVTLVPVLMGYFIRGKIPPEEKNPLNRWLVRLYRPLLDRVLVHPRITIAVGVVLLALTTFPILRLGGEFMPPLDEGDVLHMPSALPGLSAGKASQLLQQMDRLIMTVPEVERAQYATNLERLLETRIVPSLERSILNTATSRPASVTIEVTEDPSPYNIGARIDADDSFVAVPTS